MKRHDMKFFTGEVDLDVGLEDVIGDRDQPQLRRALAALSLSQHPDEGWMLAHETSEAIWLLDADRHEGDEWVDHLRGSLYPYQRALLHAAMAGPIGERARDLEWLAATMAKRRQHWRWAVAQELAVAPFAAALQPCPEWDGLGCAPISRPFVPSGWTAGDWATGGLESGRGLDCFGSQDWDNPFA